MRRVGPILAAMAVIMTGCSAPSDDLGPFGQQLKTDNRTVMFEGDDWTVQTTGDCYALIVGKRATSCLSTDYADVSFGAGRWQAGSDEFVHVALGSPTDQVRLFTDRREQFELEVVAVGDGGLAVVELEPGETPWGLQVLDADGVLLSAVSFIDG